MSFWIPLRKPCFDLIKSNIMSIPLALDEIQGTVLRNRPMPYYGCYLSFRIDDGAHARQLIEQLLPHITSAKDWSDPAEHAWINVVFTWQGLKRLGLPEEILNGFPMEFKQGMAARKEILGDTDDNDPVHWSMPHAGNGFHFGLLVMAGSEEVKEDQLARGRKAIAGISGITLIDRLDIGIPTTMREHFGYVDGLSRPFIEGQGGVPLPGQGAPVKAGEFVLGYENELGVIASGPGPEAFWKNGTYLAIRKLRQKVFVFRQFLKEQAAISGSEEMAAAKMMGRWRSGCPIALSPDKDNPELAKDPLKNNDFQYYDDDPEGIKTPVGCHIRRVNPRDALKDTSVDSRLHHLLRRGTAYGPVLPENATEDDNIDRGLVIVLVNANPGRQFEFVQSQWINDGDFISQGLRTDPIAGRRDHSDDFTYPAKPVRKKWKGLPAFAVTRGGEHVFLPGLNGIRWMIENL